MSCRDFHYKAVPFLTWIIRSSAEQERHVSVEPKEGVLCNKDNLPFSVAWLARLGTAHKSMLQTPGC